MAGKIWHALNVDSSMYVKHNVIVKVSLFLSCIAVGGMLCLFKGPYLFYYI